jgi:flagellar L-ring protein precursor FlgH
MAKIPHNTRLAALTVLTGPLILLSACMGSGSGVESSPAFAASLPPPLNTAEPATGGIFQASNGYAALTSGNRAARIGDLLTVALVERTQAAKSNSASTDRTGGFGLNPPATGPLSLFNPSDVTASGNLNFNGSGSAEQSNSLQGQISVTVAEVYPNGTMLVRGEKLMRLNRGDEFVQFSGIVRAVDVGPDNVIQSSRVADARINCSGAGEIAQASRQGWLQRFFTALSPF